MFARGVAVGMVVGASVAVGGYKFLVDRKDSIHIDYEASATNDTVASILKYGVPTGSPHVSVYKNHVLHYDQERRIPKWVAERISREHIHGSASRTLSVFEPDTSVPEWCTAQNADYWNSGWSRGHMAPAGDNKHDQGAMNDTFLLTNILPQNIDNNAGFWNRLEMYCRELTKKFDEVHVISGPLFLPHTRKTADGKQEKIVQYPVLGKSDVSVPTHLYKVIVVSRSSDPNARYVGAFVVPNEAISKERNLKEYQVPLDYIESKTGYTLLPHLSLRETKDLCSEDGCKLIPWDEFELYFIGRKISAAKTLHRLDKAWKELEKKKLTPDETLIAAYQAKRRELETLEAMVAVKD